MKESFIHEKLIKKCRPGNQQARFEIYKLYYKAMYNISLRILQDSMEAEDVMQESFLAAFSKIENRSQEVSFGSWLKKIVINKSLDYLKKRKLNLINIENKDFILQENEVNDEELIHAKVEDVKKVVNELPDHYRIVFVMYLFEGYTHEEISEYLEMSSELSRVRYKRAKEMVIKNIGSKTIQQDFIYN